MTTREGNLSVEKMFSPIEVAEKNQPSREVDDLGFQPILPVPSDAPEPSFEHPKFGNPEAIYLYQNSNGERLGYILRFPQGAGLPKGLPLTFCEGPGGFRGWRHKAFSVPRPLYGLHRLGAAPNAKVLMVEGEKTAKAARSLFPNFVVVTSPGGAMAATKCDFAALTGRDLVIWPDNDEPGQRYASDVKRLALEAGAASVTTVKIPEGFPESWDLADSVPPEFSDKDIRELATSSPAADVQKTCKAPDLQSAVDALSRLGQLEYDRVRKSESTRLRVRVGILDKAVAERRSQSEPNAARSTVGGSGLNLESPIPYPEPVNGTDVLNELVETIRRYIVTDCHEAHALALWVFFSHCFDCFEHNPRLALLSPEKRCGKTTTLSLLGALVPRALQTSNITSAALFRIIELAEPVLLIDEADTFLQNSDELRGILNAGHSKAAPFVIRTVGEDHEPRRFKVWTPVIIAKIGDLPSTLQDRSIVIKMKRKRSADKVERLRLTRAPNLEVLRSKIARWAIDHINALRDMDLDTSDDLNDRAADNWRPLLSIAKLISSSWFAHATSASLALSGINAIESVDIAIRLLEDIREIVHRETVDRISSQELITQLSKLEERPWSELNHGRPISPAILARLLRKYGIRAQVYRESPERTLRGYSIDSFADTFERYLGAQK